MSNKEIIVQEVKVSCNGGGIISGHPKVYLEINDEGNVVCPYCSTKFIYSPKLK